MLAALVAQVVAHQRSVGHDLAAVVILAVEGTQRVELGALAALVAHLVGVVEDELLDLLTIGRTALGVAHRVNEQTKLGKIEAQALVELHEHDDALGVGCRIGSAEPLDTYLVELTQTALLGTLAAEHGLGIVGLKRRGTLGYQVVLHDGAHHAGSSLGTKGQALLGLELGVGALGKDALQVGAAEHAEHLLAHDVGRLADTVNKHVYLLDCGRLDGLKAKRLEHAGRNLLHLLPGAHLGADKVAGSLRLLCLHGQTPFFCIAS